MTSSPRHYGRFLPGIIGLSIMLALVLLVCGCTQSTATSTPSAQLSTGIPIPADVTSTAIAGGKKMVTFSEEDNGTSRDIAQGTRFAVHLKENPTTGYQWNITLSPGLELQSTDFQISDSSPGMVGVGGDRTWILIAKDVGNQSFSASIQRSGETATGNGAGYNVQINVVKI